MCVGRKSMTLDFYFARPKTGLIGRKKIKVPNIIRLPSPNSVFHLLIKMFILSQIQVHALGNEDNPTLKARSPDHFAMLVGIIEHEKEHLRE